MVNKNRNLMLGSALATALLCGAGAALAQDYSGSYAGPENSYYDTQTNETVVVRPYYDRVHKRPLIGQAGKMQPEELSIATPVNYSDLNLSRRSDVRELHARIQDTARGLCNELERHDPNLRDFDGHNQCVTTATNNAMDDVFHRNG